MHKISLSFTSLAIVGLVSSIVGNPAAQAQSVPFGVIGTDDRVTPSYNFMINNGRKPVGQLEIQKADGRYYTCTFTVVGQNIGLTNTHCLLDNQGRRPLQIKAYAVRYGNRYLAAATVSRYWTGLDRSPQVAGDYPRDWAVMRFDSNLGNSTGWFGNADWSTDVSQAGQKVVGQTANHIGYSGDWPTARAIKSGEIRGATPGAHFGCQLQRIDAGLLVHNCDGTPGASGTGIHNNATQLQALDSATFTRGSLIFNVAVPLERFMPAVKILRENGGAIGTTVPRA
jgi:V8-like Glu-specific endopeptidase